MHGAGAIVFVIIGLVGLVRALLRRAAVVVGARIGSAVASVAQLVKFGRDTNWLEGNGSTFALFFAFGLGLVVIGLTVPTEATPARDTDGRAEMTEAVS